MDYVRVTNRTDSLIEGMYDGKPYEFHPGKPLDVPSVVASHVFGFKVPNKNNALQRLGWLSTSDRYKEAIARLNMIKMEDVQMVGVVVNDEEELPAETAAMVPERIGASSPLDDADGTAVGGVNSPTVGPMSADGAVPDVI